MTEVWQVLGEYREAMVLVGGWVPGLLIADGSAVHTGSLDVDVLLDPDLLKEEDRYAELVELLKSKDYYQTEHPFKLAKDIFMDEGDPIRVEVDFLLPRKPKTRRKGVLPDFRAIEAEGARFALSQQTKVELDGQMPDGRRNTVVLYAVSLVAFLVMKAHALNRRDKPKDAYDIYFTLKNAAKHAAGLAQELRPFRTNPEVARAAQILASKFKSPEDYGPSSVVKFENSEDRDFRRFLAQDAYGQMQEFLSELAKD
jgi:hypothetical protein